MKLLISFIPTVFPKHNHGGSTKILKDVVTYFGERGDKITIICNRRKNNYKEFYLHPNVLVKPVYRFKETYPNPYYTAPFYIKHIITTLFSHSRTHDKLLIFDTDFIFTDIFPKEYPVYFSLRDFLYSEALQGAFLIRKGKIIVNSEFVRDSLVATVGSVFPGVRKRINLIHNGVDGSTFVKTEPDNIKKYIKMPRANYPILLFPHRPEEDKGIFEAFKVVEKLVKKYALRDTKLLVAIGIDKGVSEQVIQYYTYLRQYVKDRGIQENVIFHDWLPQELMPEYYSLGTTTLCIGNIVEAFSNATLESLACETPVIASNIASYRSLFPNWCVLKSDYGDVDRICKHVVSIIEDESSLQLEKIRSYITNKFDKQQMCKKYWNLIHDKEYDSSYIDFKFDRLRLKNDSVFALPAWCNLSNKGIYNAYLKKSLKDHKLTALIQDTGGSFSLKEAEKKGVGQDGLLHCLENGYLLVHNS